MLIYFQNPTINQATIQNQYDKDFQVNLTDLGFKIAFGVNDYSHGTPLDNPDYVKWVVRLNRYENQKSVKKIDIKFHKCSQQDFDSFYPPADNSVEAIASVRQSLFCMNQDQDLIIYGSNNFHY